MTARTAASEELALARANPDARVWLFDFDNTLAALEIVVDWAASRRQLEPFLRGAGVADAIFSEFPKGNLPLYNALLGRLRGDLAVITAPGASAREQAEAMLLRASEIIEAHELLGVPNALALPGTADLLRTLAARGNTVAIVTSNSSRTAAAWLKLHGLAGCVQTIVGRDLMLPLKPAPDSAIRALQVCGASVDEAVLVGDSEADFGAARASGIGFYGIAAARDRRDLLIAAGAAEVFASPAALAIGLNLTVATIE
jgi:phosphoglycolate phosphatase-like HAD superfamily hydrolase